MMRWTRLLPACGLLLVAGTLLFYELGSNGVHELDEAWHAQAALEMYRSGEAWSPTAFGRPYFNKPALPIWLAAASFRQRHEMQVDRRV